VTFIESTQGISLRRLFRQLETQSALFFAASVQQEDSRGQVTLVSSDPRTQVKIDYNYLSADTICAGMRESSAPRADPADPGDEAVVQTVRRDQSADPR